MEKYWTPSAMVIGILFVVNDAIHPPNGGGFLVAGSILIGSAVIASALRKSS